MGLLTMLIIKFVLGILLVVAAIMQVVLAARARHGLSIGTSVVGLASIVGVWISGMTFLGHGANSASTGMAAAAGLAMLRCAVSLRASGSVRPDPWMRAMAGTGAQYGDPARYRGSKVNRHVDVRSGSRRQGRRGCCGRHDAGDRLDRLLR
jgi:hypothetical protein